MCLYAVSNLSVLNALSTCTFPGCECMDGAQLKFHFFNLLSLFVCWLDGWFNFFLSVLFTFFLSLTLLPQPHSICCYFFFVCFLSSISFPFFLFSFFLPFFLSFFLYFCLSFLLFFLSYFSVLFCRFPMPPPQFF